MNAVTWVADSDPDEDLHLGRWALAAGTVLVVHAGLVVAYMFMTPPIGITGADVPSLVIDFAPEAAAPDLETIISKESVDSQPTMQPEAKEQATEEPVIEIPPVPAPEPDIVIPPKKELVEEKKEALPQPKPPEPVEKPVAQQQQSVAAPPESTKAEKRSEKPVAPAAGTTAARNAIVNYASTLSAHLQRFKRPGTGKGTAVVSFTVNRNGQVIARSIVRSSGSSIVDNEALAMIMRAQPMPAFPAAVKQSEETFVQSIRFR
jgi:protein TonB